MENREQEIRQDREDLIEGRNAVARGDPRRADD